MPSRGPCCPRRRGGRRAARPRAHVTICTTPSRTRRRTRTARSAASRPGSSPTVSCSGAESRCSASIVVPGSESRRSAVVSTTRSPSTPTPNGRRRRTVVASSTDAGRRRPRGGRSSDGEPDGSAGRTSRAASACGSASARCRAALASASPSWATSAPAASSRVKPSTEWSIQFGVVDRVEGPSQRGANGRRQDPHRDVEARGLRGPRRVVGSGREVDDITGGQADVADPVDVPLLRHRDLQHDDVVVVGVAAEPGSRWWAQVGVGLHGVAEVRFEIEAELTERGPEALQSLHDHRRAVGDVLEDPVDVGDVVEVDPSDARAHRVVGDRDRAAFAHESERRAAAEVRQHHLDRGHVQQVVERADAASQQRRSAPVLRGERIEVADTSAQRVTRHDRRRRRE